MKKPEKRIQEVVLWLDSKVPTWCPIDKERGTVTTGTMFCNNVPPNTKVVGEFRYSGDPIFSTPIVTFYEKGTRRQ